MTNPMLCAQLRFAFFVQASLMCTAFVSLSGSSQAFSSEISDRKAFMEFYGPKESDLRSAYTNARIDGVAIGFTKMGEPYYRDVYRIEYTLKHGASRRWESPSEAPPFRLDSLETQAARYAENVIMKGSPKATKYLYTPEYFAEIRMGPDGDKRNSLVDLRLSSSLHRIQPLASDLLLLRKRDEAFWEFVDSADISIRSFGPTEVDGRDARELVLEYSYKGVNTLRGEAVRGQFVYVLLEDGRLSRATFLMDGKVASEVRWSYSDSVFLEGGFPVPVSREMWLPVDFESGDDTLYRARTLLITKWEIDPTLENSSYTLSSHGIAEPARVRRERASQYWVWITVAAGLGMLIIGVLLLRRSKH